jgi:acetyl-CoA synthetase
MDTAADSERTPAPGGAVPSGAAGGTGAGASTSPASDGATSDEASAACGTGPAAEPGRSAEPPRSRSAAAALVFDDPLDRPSADDTDRGWGELPTGSADDDFTRFLREKPPHHL